MKKSKVFIAFMALVVCALMGSAISFSINCSPALGAVAGMAIGIALSAVPMPKGVARAGVFVEVWTGELVKQFNHADTATWLDGVPDYSRYSKNAVIHLVDVGIDPEVLINNSTYPIPITALNDSDIPVSLDKLTTEATPITDDELYALSYDKITLVKEKHGNAITIKKYDKAIHAFAPASHTSATPIVMTSGVVGTDGRKPLLKADIIALKKKFDDAKVPTAGRRLVLCPDHVQDLLLVDQKFADQYYNYTTGKIANLFGFEVFEYVSNPIFTSAGAKKSFGAVASAGEFQASVAFHAPTMFKAADETKMYYSEAKNDPLTHRNLVNFEHRYIAMPKKNKAIGAIVSTYDAGAVTESVVATPDTLSFLAAGESKVIAVTATSAFTAAVTGTGFTIATVGNAVTVTAAVNAGAQRTGTVTITVTADNTKTDTVALTQVASA